VTVGKPFHGSSISILTYTHTARCDIGNAMCVGKHLPERAIAKGIPRAMLQGRCSLVQGVEKVLLEKTLWQIITSQNWVKGVSWVCLDLGGPINTYSKTLRSMKVTADAPPDQRPHRANSAKPN